MIIGIVGLGYVGLPLAIAFSKKYQVIGYDPKQERVEDLKDGIDKTKEVGQPELKRFAAEKPVIVDIKGFYDGEEAVKNSFTYLTL